jgi:hypothetical protein
VILLDMRPAWSWILDMSVPCFFLFVHIHQSSCARFSAAQESLLIYHIPPDEVL